MLAHTCASTVALQRESLHTAPTQPDWVAKPRVDSEYMN